MTLSSNLAVVFQHRPGHTHEDIDAVFKLIHDLWKEWRCVLSPKDFEKMLREGVAGFAHARMHVHAYVYSYNSIRIAVFV